MKNLQIETYKQNEHQLKEHQKITLNILSERLKINSGKANILEIGCANGNLLLELAKRYPLSHILSVEISSKLCEISREKLAQINHPSVNIIEQDITSYCTNTKFDCIIAEGVHSVFDDPISEISRWLSFLKKDGILLLFGLFAPEQLEYKFHYKNLQNDFGWESGFNAISTDSINQKFASDYDITTLPFNITIDLPKVKNNPIKTHTVDLNGKKNLVLAGSLILTMYHIILKKK